MMISQRYMITKTCYRYCHVKIKTAPSSISSYIPYPVKPITVADVSLCRQYYHPAVLSAYMNYHERFNSELKIKKNFKLHKLFRYATNVLHIVNKSVGQNGISTSRGRDIPSSVPVSVEVQKKRSLILAKELLSENVNPFEIQSLAAFMTILLPSSNDWYELDKIICSKLNYDFLKNCGIHPLLMLSHLLSTASEKYPYNLRNQFRSQQVITNMIVMPDGNIPILNDAFNETGIMKIDTVSGMLVKVGLLLELLAQSPDSLNLQKKTTLSSKLCAILDLIDKSVIDNKENNVQVSLKLIEPLWKYTPLLDLPDNFMVYKSLFKLCESCIEVDIENALFDENTMLSLLEGLEMSSFKFRNLIRLIFTRMFTFGIGNLTNGIQIFRVLIELDETLLATEILNAKVDKDKIFLDKPDDRELSDVAKNRIYHLLGLSHHIRSAEIRLALVAFSNEPKHSRFYRKLIGIEELLIAEIPRFSLEEVMSIYVSYGHAVRRNGRVLEALDNVILKYYDSLTVSQQSYLLYTCAKLNHKPSYINQVAENIISFYSKPALYNVSAISAMIKSMWSMAVLDLLRYKHWAAVHEKIDNVRSSFHPFVEKQLETITAELQIRARLAQSKSNENGADNKSTSDVCDIEDKMVNFMESISVQSDPTSSRRHMEVSRILRNLGIPHRNEVRIEYNYTVDILLTETTLQYPKGIIIEFDGPTHFETYLFQPEGSTMLRRRHIRSMGYKLISIPFLQYGRQTTLKCKEKLLLDYLNDKIIH